MADNQAQQRDQDVVLYSAFRGLRNDVAPERFENADLAVASNCDLDKSGRLSRRAGFTKQVAGAVHSLWADDAQSLCLFASGGQLKRLANDLSTTTLRTLADASARISFTKTNDIVYFSNGADTGIVQNGAARSWGIAVPPLPTPTITVGYMPAGDYQFVMTYVRRDGQESGAPLAGVVTVPAGGGLSLALPVSADADVAYKRIYLTTPNGDDLYLALTVMNSITSTIYSENTTELNLPLDMQFLQPAPAGQLVAYYRGRMFVAVGDTLYPSEPYAYELFDYRNFIQMDGQITLLAAMEDKERSGDAQHSGFFVGTDRSCGVIVGAEPSDFQYVPKTNYGAILGALDYVDGSVFGDNSLGARSLPMWLTTQGICVGKPDMEIQNLTRTKYGFTAAGQGAALFMPGPNRFIATSNY
jgi:hypothetical protein